jgi:hypothetical protein
MQDEYMGISPTDDFGDSFGDKPDGYISLAGGDINGFNITLFNNHKGNDLHQFCKILMLMDSLDKSLISIGT